MLKNKKIKLSLLLMVFIVCMVFVYPILSIGKIKPYYSGDAVSFGGKVFISSINMNEFELFTVENKKIVKKNSLTSYWYEGEKYFDSLFNIEKGKLFVYLVNGKYFYKYRVYSDGELKLIEKTKTHDWKWFIRLAKTDNRVVVISSERARYWNQVDVVDEFRITSEPAGNIYTSFDNNNIFSIENNKLNVFDTEKRKITESMNLVLKEKEMFRNVINDSNNIYVVDDESLKAFNFYGDLQKEFKFTADLGYAVQFSADKEYLYFSDGIGVVKVDKKTFEPVDWAYTMNMASNSWAMHIEVVGDEQNEQIVVFNNANIMLLDKNMDLVDYYTSKEKTNAPVKELSLKRSVDIAYPGDIVTVSGEGFGLNEVVEIEIAKEKFRAATNNAGDFNVKLNVPKSDPQKCDIKVTGESSGRTYSISFEIL